MSFLSYLHSIESSNMNNLYIFYQGIITHYSFCQIFHWTFTSYTFIVWKNCVAFWLSSYQRIDYRVQWKLNSYSTRAKITTDNSGAEDRNPRRKPSNATLHVFLFSFFFLYITSNANSNGKHGLLKATHHDNK